MFLKNFHLSFKLVNGIVLFMLLTGCKKENISTDDPTILLYEFNRSITANGTTIGVGKEVEVDLDNDGTNDIVMTAFYSYFDGKSYRGINGTTLYVSADTSVFFVPGSTISTESILATDNTVYSNAKDAGFIGFSMVKSDGPHFGWLKASGNSNISAPLVSITATIKGAAMKSLANVGIEAGKF